MTAIAQTPGIEIVHLYGELAEKFGSKLKIKGNSVARVVQIIEANFPGKFLKALYGGEYFVWLGDKTPVADQEDMLIGTSQKELHIYPRVAGSSNNKGGIMAVLGVIIVGAAIILSGGSLAAPLASMGQMGTMASAFTQFGIGMIISGVGMMISPMPDMNVNSVDQNASSIFSGQTNIMSEGGAIPVNYGEVIVGSTSVSVGLEIEQIAIST